MKLLRRICVGMAVTAALLTFLGVALHTPRVWQPSSLAMAGLLAIGLRLIPSLRTYQFTAWIIVAVTVGMIYPQWFKAWGPVNPRDPWLILIVVQLVMFGMGTQMSLKDLAGVARSPRGVLVGIVCHFSVMPLVGFGLTRLFRFPDEIAAGIILIGSCSSGLASNVMSYIARANLALAVTVTAVTTLLAPLLTPQLMKYLAGDKVEVDVAKMMMDIVTMVLVPIGAALLHDHLKHASLKQRALVALLAISGAGWMSYIARGGWGTVTAHMSPNLLPLASVGGFLLAGVVFGVAYHGIWRLFPALDGLLPLSSMAGIVYFTTVTTAAGRDNLLRIGAMLFFASAIHNAAGYFFGYWLARVTGLDRNSCRAVAFEVGLQNGGMATGIASSMDKLATLGLAAAIFSPWMNISGSILANYWRRKPLHHIAKAPSDLIGSVGPTTVSASRPDTQVD